MIITPKLWEDIGAAGTITKNYIYDAFGNEQYTMADSNPFRYCGEYADRETGLLYLRNRYYDPSTGRFITEDPIQDGNNWYVYANNNPVMYIDPWGLESYILYIPEFEREAYEDRQDLIDMGVAEDEIIMVPVNSAKDFKNGWNNMGYVLDENGNRTMDEDGNYLTYDSIDYVILGMHGNPNSLGSGDRDSNKWSFGVNDIKFLEEKNITQNVLILACYAGHLDYKETNPAALLAKKVNGALVIANDGKVSARTPDGFYKSEYDPEFDHWIDRAEGAPRESAGWVVYRNPKAGVHTTRATGGSGKLVIWGAMQLSY